MCCLAPGLRRGLASKPLKICTPPAESSPDSTRLASWFFKPGSAGGCPGSEVQGVRIEWRGGSVRLSGFPGVGWGISAALDAWVERLSFLVVWREWMSDYGIIFGIVLDDFWGDAWYGYYIL